MEESFKTVSSTSSEVRQAGIREQLQAIDLSQKDSDLAFLIELVGGLLGFLGLGYIYSGLTNNGLLRLLGYWALGFGVFAFLTICATLTLGLGACLFLPAIPLFWAVAFFSASDLKKAMETVKAAQASGVMPTPGYLNRPGAQDIDDDPLAALERDLSATTTSPPPPPAPAVRTYSEPVHEEPVIEDDQMDAAPQQQARSFLDSPIGPDFGRAQDTTDDVPDFPLDADTGDSSVMDSDLVDTDPLDAAIGAGSEAQTILVDTDQDNTVVEADDDWAGVDDDRWNNVASDDDQDTDLTNDAGRRDDSTL